MKTKFTLLGGAALLAFAGLGTATTVQAKESWGKGAPEFSDPDGNIKFKVRGRVQYDYVNSEVDFNNTNAAGTSLAVNSNDQTTAQTRVRRARIGVEGAFDSKFKYKLEFNLLGRNSGSSEVELEDAFIEYAGGSLWSVVIGNQDLGSTMERMNSSRFITNMERNMGESAFGFGRTPGIFLLLGQDNWGVHLGVNGDNTQNADLTGDQEEAFEARAHAYWTPINTPTQLVYVGGTLRDRDAQDGSKLTYRARPGTNVGTRIADTTNGTSTALPASGFDSDMLYSIEAAGKYGPFYAQAEYTVLEADGVSGSGATRVELDPSFTTYFVQGGYFLTGESRPYKGGKFDRVTPNAPVSEGGIGAWELRARYDHIDLDDQGGRNAANTGPAWVVDGGSATTYTLGVNWTPVKNIRFMGEYVKGEAEDRTIPTTTTGSINNKNGDIDTIQLRAQFDF